MDRRALAALAGDLRDLAAALHLLADAHAKRADEDGRGALRLLARHVEGMQETIEALTDEESRTASVGP